MKSVLAAFSLQSQAIDTLFQYKMYCGVELSFQKVPFKKCIRE